MKQTEGVGRLR